MSRTALLLSLLLLAGCAASRRPGAGAGPDDDEVDRLGLAALLIKDGHFERAGMVLEEVDPATEGLDQARWRTLRGLVALHAGDHARARDELLLATKTGQVEPITWVYLAQAHAGAGEHQEVLRDLERAGDAWTPMAGMHRLRVHAAWMTGDRVGALAALEAAERRFPGEDGFTRQRLVYLLELGLVHEAAALGRGWLERTNASAEAWVAVGEALRRARAHDQAAVLLETARLLHPAHPKVLLALARAHLDAGRPRAAAVVMEEAALEDPELLCEAAELHRRAGDLDRALWLNAQVADQKEKTRQRLAVLLQRGWLEQAAALAPRVSRLGLLAEDEEVRYALAWVHHRTGEHEKASALLKGITRPELFRAAAELLRAIEAERAAEGSE